MDQKQTVTCSGRGLTENNANLREYRMMEARDTKGGEIQPRILADGREEETAQTGQ